MLLVDALHLNSPGGIVLLKYLYKKLFEAGAPSFFLLDKRTENDFSYFVKSEKYFLESTIKNRKLFYLRHKNTFSKVLCFSNIPPPIPLSIPVFTFFQNVMLLKDCHYYSIKSRILYYLKRQFIFYHRNNSNTWIVQTGFVKELLIKKLRISEQRIQVLPFFSDPDKIVSRENRKKTGSFIYPSTGAAHKNHILLLKAWALLYNAGYNFELHLTIPDTDSKLVKMISSLKSKGVKIINHGFIGQDQLLSLYQSTEYLVYPSLNESFGLPLIEAIQQNCKVIVADLPYSNETIAPTAKFNPHKPSFLKNSIIELTSNKNSERKSEIILENKIDLLVNLITT